MIGQKNLFLQLDKLNSLDELSKSILICGSKGSGRHSFANEIASKFNMEFELVNYELSLDLLNDMYALSIPKFYLIDFDDIARNKRIDRFQNTLLKFIEEPPVFAWILIIVDDLNSILETIKNRCQIYYIEPYSLEELKSIAELNGKNFNDDILKLLKTPGNVIEKDENQISSILSLSDLIITSLERATPSNALSIEKKFFGDSSLDLEFFLIMFTNRLYLNYNISYDKKYFEAILLSNELIRKLNIMNVNKIDLFENYILRLKNILVTE